MDEEKASEMRDMVTSKVRGTNTKRNIPLERRKHVNLEMLQNSETMELKDFIQYVHSLSDSFTNKKAMKSPIRGVSQLSSGEWEVRLAGLGAPDSTPIYLGTFDDKFEADKACDSALVRLKGPVAKGKTSLPWEDYESELLAYFIKEKELIKRKEKKGDAYLEWAINGKPAISSPTVNDAHDQPERKEPKASARGRGVGKRQPKAGIPPAEQSAKSQCKKAKSPRSHRTATSTPQSPSNCKKTTKVAQHAAKPSVPLE